MLRDIVTSALSAQPDIECRAAEGPGISAALESHAPDVLLFGVEAQENVLDFLPLALKHGGVGLVAIASDARSATVHHVTVTSQPVTDLSSASIVAAVRSASRRAHAKPE